MTTIIVIRAQTAGCSCHPEPSEYTTEVYMGCTEEEARADFLRLYPKAKGPIYPITLTKEDHEVRFS